MPKKFAEFRDHTDWETTLRGSTGIWVNEVLGDFRKTLHDHWATLPPGGFLGGPSWGCGGLTDGRFVLNSRKVIETFRTEITDGSELFLGCRAHPCWMIFKRPPTPQRILIISGCDARQMNYFGRLTNRNHEHYARPHGYQTRWHIWDPSTWGTSREQLVWAKLKAVADALAEGSWDQVWWIDADAAFLNLEKKLPHFFHHDWDGIFPNFIGPERSMISTGVFGARPALGPLLHDLWKNGTRGGPFNEESALIDSVEANPHTWHKIQTVNHDLFNGVYGSNLSQNDPERAFVCHLVGQSHSFRRKVFWELNQSLGI